MKPVNSARNRTLRLYSPSLAILCVLIPFFSYYLKQVKIQEGLQNDRAFRMLDLIAGQFSGEIDGAHKAMDASLRVKAKPTGKQTSDAGKCPQNDAVVAIQNYLNAYVVDKFTPPPGDSIPLAAKNDEKQTVCEVVVDPDKANTPPPHSHSIVQFQDSKTYLELSHGGMTDAHRKVRIRAFLDPAKMLERALKDDRSAIFDTVFASSLEQTGDVLAQKSNSPVNVTLVETLLKSARLHTMIEADSGSKPSDDGKLSATPELSTAISGANQRFDVQVAGGSYVLFVVPAPFQLTDQRPLTNLAPARRIAFYGLVRKESLEKQAMGLPDLALPAIMLTLSACLAFLWPPLKLFTMSDRERLGKGSVANIALLASLACVFLGALILSFGLYLTLSEEESLRLPALANAIHSRLVEELNDGFAAADVLRCVDPKKMGTSISFSELKKTQPDVAAKLEQRYPFFQHLILSDSAKGAANVGDQRQIFKITANLIPTPLISLPEAEFPFMGRLNLNPSISGKQEFVLQSFVSPNTGQFLPIVTFTPPAAMLGGILKSSMRITLTSELPSLVHAILPRGYGFAVIDPDGTVQFHSEPYRNLKENFFSECDEVDARELRKWIALKEEHEFAANYGGQAITAFVRPLGDEKENFGLSLIVFSKVAVKAHRVTNIGSAFLLLVGELILISGTLAAIYWFLSRKVEHRSMIAYLRHRVWPRKEDKALYVVGSAWFLAWFLCALTLVLRSQSIADLDFLLGILFTLWFLCCAGLFYLLHRRADFDFLLKANRLNAALKTVSLKVAYSTVIFSATLGVVGILFMSLFQMRINDAQQEEARDDRAHYSERLKARAERIGASLHKRCPDASRAAINEETRTSFDVYQWDGQSSAVAGIGPIATDSRDLSPRKGNSDPLWRVLPAISQESLKHLYFPFALLLAAILVWLYHVVNRLFFLDFRQPEKLPHLIPQELEDSIQEACNPANKKMVRCLVFAHPQSGTSELLSAIVDRLASTGWLAAPDKVITDFSQLGALSEENTQQSCSAAAQIAKTNRIAILDNFEHQITDSQSRNSKLALLEAIVYSHSSSVYVLTSSDPILLVQSLLNEDPDNPALRSELASWTRVLSSFEPSIYSDNSVGAVLALAKQIRASLLAAKGPLDEDQRDEMVAMASREFASTPFLGRMARNFDISKLELQNPYLFEDSLIRLVRHQADRQYRALWINCTSDERLALYQLAKDNWLNPQNRLAISHLLRKKLIVRNSDLRDDGPYSLMNVSFRSFVLEAVTQYELDTWKSQQNLSLWPAMRMALGTIVIVLAAFMFYVQRASFDAYFGYLAVLAGGGTALIRIILQFFTKSNPTLSDLVGGGAPKGESAKA